MNTIDALRHAAQAWISDDPDPNTRAELEAVLSGLPATLPDLADRFAGRLTFGTAGLRGVLRAGPNGMNLAVVTQAAAGLVAWLASKNAVGPIVIGYDARYGSREFAERTAAVATGAGRPALVMATELPTPVLAHAVRALDACAGVMVTASHNPPRDNGYKVYLGARLGGVGGAGAQLVAPADAEIEAAIRAVGPLAMVPLGEPGDPVPPEIVESYLAGAVAVLDPRRPAAERADLLVAYTPLHGVGGATLRQAFVRAGFAPTVTVAEQADPDPAFPTVAFPNPEEPGAMDLVIQLAESISADIAIANDPDADRCAVAIPGPDRRWRVLRGDEVGVLLADHLIERGVTGVYATTIVSSSLLAQVCRRHGVDYAQTLTGFKWIVRAGGEDAERLVYGYEEALGYCVAPNHVRDKDGITAALLVAEIAARLKADGRTLADRLDDLAHQYGVYATDQLAVRVSDLSLIGAAMARLSGHPPSKVLGDPVTEVVIGEPASDVITLRTRRARVVVRPSGTEPKLKAYLEVVEPVTDGDVPDAPGQSDVSAARSRAQEALTRLRAEVNTALGW